MKVKQIVAAIAPRNRLQAAVLAAIVVGSLSAGVSYATIPDSSGLIHGCYNNKSGALRVIDPDKTASCPKNSTGLDWNQGLTSVGGLSGLQEFTSSATWVDPPGVTGVLFEAAGGGGGGGLAITGCTTTAPGGFDYPQLGQAGGTGGYIETVVPVFPGDHYTVEVGTGGVGATKAGALALPGGGSELIDPTGTVDAGALGGAAGSNAVADGNGCGPEAPSPAAGGVAFAQGSGGFLFNGGGCKMPLTTVTACGSGGAGGQNWNNIPIGISNGVAGDNGDVVLEW